MPTNKQHTPPTRTCPITGTPLPAADRKAVISRQASDDFKNRCNAISRLMEAAQEALTPTRSSGDGGRTRPGSKPPLNLHALSVLTEAQHIIQLWAVDLLQNQFPNTSFVHGDWATIQNIYRQADLVHYYPAPEMIEEVDQQLGRLRILTEPPSTPDLKGARLIQAREHLKTLWLPLSYACAAVEGYTGQRLPESTVRTWANKGKVDRDEWGRYQVQQLIDRQDTGTR